MCFSKTKLFSNFVFPFPLELQITLFQLNTRDIRPLFPFLSMPEAIMIAILGSPAIPIPVASIPKYCEEVSGMQTKIPAELFLLQFLFASCLQSIKGQCNAMQRVLVAMLPEMQLYLMLMWVA